MKPKVDLCIINTIPPLLIIIGKKIKITGRIPWCSVSLIFMGHRLERPS